MTSAKLKVSKSKPIRLTRRAGSILLIDDFECDTRLNNNLMAASAVGTIGKLLELDRALMLLYLEEKKQTEIAEILGLSVANVSTKVGRVKEKLKKQFSNQ